MRIGRINLDTGSGSRSESLKEAVLASFWEPAPGVRARLGEFSLGDWQRAKYWLDVSGLALYFFDRLQALDLVQSLPPSFADKLETHRDENRRRTVALFDEAVAVCDLARKHAIEIALLKGISLPPESVPDTTLRNQIDLDLLIRESDAQLLKRTLADLGYTLDVVSGDTWEFKAGPSGISGLKHIYQVRPERAIDVHLTPAAQGRPHSDCLQRAQWRPIRGHELPALLPADAFVYQARHLFKHICNDHTRASWVLEYWRHVCARRNDAQFWSEVKSIAAGDPGTDIAIGAATLLTSHVFGPFAPEELSGWSMNRLSPAICLWIQLYWRRLLLSDTPRHKLYLLLRKELNPDSHAEHRARRRLLFPFHWPQRITRPTKDETVAARLIRYRTQARFVLHRLGFHVVEGIALAIESFRWQRLLQAVNPKDARSGNLGRKQPLPLPIVLLATLLIAHGAIIEAQTLPATAPATSEPTTADRAADSETETDAPSTRVSLSASQIISILQGRPQLIVELKQFMAEAQQQGGTDQGDSISDEMLYRQIATDQELRNNITAFLRARGYLDDHEISRFAGSDGDSVARKPQIDRNFPDSGIDPLYARLPEDQSSESATDRLLIRGESAAPARKRARSDANLPAREAKQGNITDEPSALHRPAPYNLRSLRDLYSQIPNAPERLSRFGSEVFTHRGGSIEYADGNSVTPLDVPIGPDYVLGPGDRLTIDLWGGISQNISRTVALDGHVSLPESGDIQIAGLTLEKAQELIQSELKKQYRDAQVSVTLSRLRTIRIYVVGDVQRPGAYEISSLASPLNALYAAGGPTAVGSLRILQHYRGQKLLSTIDLYDFLLHGVRRDDDRLEGGDTLVVPTSGPQVAISGAVKRPAIYELKGATTLEALLEDAGGTTVAAALGHIVVDRIDANRQRETLSVSNSVADDPAANQKAISGFLVEDGDRVHVEPIAPYSERVVYLEGHVVRPGRQAYRDGMRLSDVLRSYQDLLPEPAAQGELIRLVPPDLHVETVDFNLPDVLVGNSNLPLQPFDTIRVLGRYDADAPKVEIRGEVMRPGSYPLSEGMTASQLVRIAGGFKRDALVDTADLISYRIVNGTKIESQRADVRIGDAVERDDPGADRPLKAGDVLTVHQITGWNDIGASITIEGEVAHPGSYGFQEGERLSDVLRRAGGFRETAYPAGSVLIREQVRELEEKSRVELIHQIETSTAAARLSSDIKSADQSAQMQLVQQQQEQILSRLKNQPATGRMVIHISQNIDAWAGTPADIEVRRGDVLRIPKRPGFVLVSGQVYNTSAITFTPGKSAGWYLQHAGGATSAADRKEIFVIRANGSVVGRRSGEWYDHNVLSTRLEPGDVVVVPQKIIGASLLWRNLLSTAQIASSIAITAAVAGF